MKKTAGRFETILAKGRLAALAGAAAALLAACSSVPETRSTTTGAPNVIEGAALPDQAETRSATTAGTTISGAALWPSSSARPAAGEAAYPLADGAVRFGKSSFAELPPVTDESWEAALAAFKLSCSKMGTGAMWLDACSNAQFVGEGRAREFFLTWFDLWRVAADTRATNASNNAGIVDTGLATGYYEPLLRGSRTRHGPYQHPIYRVPDDLIAVELDALYPQLKGLRLRGKLVGGKLVPYDSRAEIERRARLGQMQRYALCWVDDPVEAFFLQIQGSGRIALEDGTYMRVGFADQNGHPYKAVAKWLAENAGLSLSEMSMQRIKRWAKENPQRTQELLNANPNFVFFAERKGGDPELGPIGAQGVPLTAQASVAVDRRYWPLGLPFVIDVKQTRPAQAFTRAVVAQDTGSAIRGVLRFDYFWGFGEAAAGPAGAQKSAVRAWILMPKGEDPRRRMQTKAAGSGATAPRI